VNTSEIEWFLAKLYTDELVLERFVNDPSDELIRHGISDESIGYFLQLDLQDVMLAAHSYSHKRNQYTKRRAGFFAKLRRLIS
jgi:hypothetical protein